MGEWSGVDRRKDAPGRREHDKCAHHCFLVRDLQELKNQHKEDIEESEIRWKGTAPLWSVIALISILIGSSVYSFTETAKIRGEVHSRITAVETKISNSLSDINTKLTAIQTRQDIILQSHPIKLNGGKGNGG